MVPLWHGIIGQNPGRLHLLDRADAEALVDTRHNDMEHHGGNDLCRCYGLLLED